MNTNGFIPKLTVCVTLQRAYPSLNIDLLSDATQKETFIFSAQNKNCWRFFKHNLTQHLKLDFKWSHFLSFPQMPTTLLTFWRKMK